MKEMKLEVKIVIGLLAGILLMLGIVAVRSGPGLTPLEEYVLADKGITNSIEIGKLASKRLAELEALVERSKTDAELKKGIESDFPNGIDNEIASERRLLDTATQSAKGFQRLRNAAMSRVL